MIGPGDTIGSSFDCSPATAAALPEVATRLRALGYTEGGIRERLAIPDLATLSLSSFFFHRGERRVAGAPLDVAIRLFLLADRVTLAELATVLDEPARATLLGQGILAVDGDGGEARSLVSLFPIGDRLFFADPAAADAASAARPDAVMYLGPDSHCLARSTIRRPVRAVLDLCTGSGVQAILAAAHAEVAVGVDANPRAVACARWNALFQPTHNAAFLPGDLYAPVEPARFDLILANPPFVPAPADVVLFRDGGPSGDGILQRIVAGLPDRLLPGGVAQIFTQLGERAGESCLDRVRSWLDGARMNLYALRLREVMPETYATAHATGKTVEEYAASVDAWAANLRAQAYARIASFVLTFSWADAAERDPWTRVDAGAFPQASGGAEIASMLFAERLSRTPGIGGELAHRKVRIPGRLVLVERRAAAAEGLLTEEILASLRGRPLGLEHSIDPLARALLEGIGGGTGVAALLDRLAEDGGRFAPAPTADACLRALGRLLALGLITLE